MNPAYLPTNGRLLLYTEYQRSREEVLYKMNSFLEKMKQFDIDRTLMIELGVRDYDFSTNRFSKSLYGIPASNDLGDRVFRTHFRFMLRNLAGDISKNQEKDAIYAYLEAKVLKKSRSQETNIYSSNFWQRATCQDCIEAKQKIEKFAKKIISGGFKSMAEKQAIPLYANLKKHFDNCKDDCEATYRSLSNVARLALTQSIIADFFRLIVVTLSEDDTTYVYNLDHLARTYFPSTQSLPPYVPDVSALQLKELHSIMEKDCKKSWEELSQEERDRAHKVVSHFQRPSVGEDSDDIFC